MTKQLNTLYHAICALISDACNRFHNKSLVLILIPVRRW